jgi:hypothetical protein
MERVEALLREGMAERHQRAIGADRIVLSITSFALYGFPESHAASFALIVYASAYLKAHFPAAFYTALLNNQPMGFYHPATLVKDAQRRGVRFAPIDVQVSDERRGAPRRRLCWHRDDNRAAPDGDATEVSWRCAASSGHQICLPSGTEGACAWRVPSSRGSGRARQKGFVFLTLEDETGIANVIVQAPTVRAATG